MASSGSTTRRSVALRNLSKYEVPTNASKNPSRPIMISAILQCHNLGKRFTQGDLDVQALLGVNLSIAKGEMVAIMGASGSGKSTLLHLLGGLEAPSTGEVILHGDNMHTLSAAKRCRLRNKSLGFVYQSHHLLADFSVLENVAMPALIGGCSVRQASKQAAELLEKVGLSARVHHKPAELSGGEAQRVSVARALINAPKCILADEPTGNLDSKTAEQIHALMLQLNQQLQVSFIIATHSHTLASQMHRVLRLEDGVILEQDEEC